MKILSALVIGLFTLGLANTTFATEPNMSGGPGALENIFPLNEKMDLPDFAERLTTPESSDVQSSDVTDNTYTCRAWTTCPNGSRISCWSRGYRCYSSVIPGYRVYCSATSRRGYTKYWVYYCY